MVRDLAAVGLDREDRAALDALAVEVDDAGAALAGVAADVGAGQPKIVAQEVDEQEPGLDFGRVGRTVDRNVDGNLRGSFRHATCLSFCGAPSRGASTRIESP